MFSTPLIAIKTIYQRYSIPLLQAQPFQKGFIDFKEMQNAFVLPDYIDKCLTFKNVEML